VYVSGQEGKRDFILGKFVLTNNIPVLKKPGSWCNLPRREEHNGMHLFLSLVSSVGVFYFLVYYALKV
jgi:hypothetical protein